MTDNEQKIERLEQELAELRLETNICPFCLLNEATLLCDFILGFDGTKKGVNGARWDCRNGEMFTCDRPICRDCSTQYGGPIFFCGTDENGNSEGWVDTTDYCPTCAAREKFTGEDRRRNIITRFEAQQIRKEVWRRDLSKTFVNDFEI